jgi:uncharacterized RDD family membrane protein YckC
MKPDPETVHDDTMSTAVEPCSLIRRLLIMIYDTVVIVGLLILTAILALLAQQGERKAFEDPAYTAFLAGVWFLYLGWCWTKVGMTVGMRAWRVQIVDEDGSRPGWRKCIVRFVFSVISALALGAGFWWSLADPQKRCWHDIVSHTRLIRSGLNRSSEHHDGRDN